MHRRVCLTLSNILPLHVFKRDCASSRHQDCVSLPALMFLLAGLAPHHTEVTRPILAAAGVCACRRLRGLGRPKRTIIPSCDTKT